VFQEKSGVRVDDRKLHLVKDKDVGQRLEESKAETELDARFWPTDNEEFDTWNPPNQTAHDGEDGRPWVLRPCTRRLAEHCHRRSVLVKGSTTLQKLTNKLWWQLSDTLDGSISMTERPIPDMSG